MDLLTIITFWKKQFEEHAFFIDIGLVDVDSEINILKNNAKKWVNYWRDLPLNDEIIYTELYIEMLLRNCDSFKKFKMDVINNINLKFCGWLIPDFVDHLKDELEYFVKLITTDVEPIDIIKFWTEINKDHCQTIYQLLDSKEKILFDTYLNFSKEFDIIYDGISIEDIQISRLSLICTRDLDKFLLKTKNGIYDRSIKSVIHPVLIDHIKRENERAMFDIRYALSRLKI